MNSHLQGRDTKQYVGIDVSKDWLDVALHQGQNVRFDNDVAGQEAPAASQPVGPAPAAPVSAAPAPSAAAEDR